MKKVLLIVVVAALALTLVPLAIAGARGGGGWKHGKAKFNLVGKVVSVDATATDGAAGTININFKAGTKSVRSLRGDDDAMFVVDTNAMIWLLGRHGRVRAKTLADMEPGDRVKARGVITEVEGVDENGAPTMVKVYTIKNLKYRDLTPDEVIPPVEPSPEPAAL